MEMLRINYLAILVGVIANVILGFLWYGPLFGKAWAKEMKMPPDFRSIMAMGLFMIFPFCGREIDFHTLNNINYISVVTNLNVEIKSIREKDKIDGVIAFAKRFKEGWGMPIAGPPVAPIRIQFFSGDDLKADLGIARNFITTTGDNFYSREITPEESREILMLLDLKESDLRW